MAKHSNKQAFIFIIVLSIIAALILSAVSQALKDKQELNVEIDMKKNILSAFELYNKPGCKKNVVACYNTYVKSFVVDYKGNKKNTKIKPEKISLDKQFDRKADQRLFPVFIKTIDGKTSAYCIPIVGKGLWSTLYGYLALKEDINTVLGITFYRHAETPGLGAEIEQKWFQDNFKGKKIFDRQGKLVSIKVVKGKVNPKMKNIEHKVDGISGATLTADGVTHLLKKSLSAYEPYFTFLKKEKK